MSKKMKVLTEEEMLKTKNRFNTILEYSFISKEADLLLDEDEDEQQPTNQETTDNQNQETTIESGDLDINRDEKKIDVNNEIDSKDTEESDSIQIDITDLTDKQQSIEDKVDLMTKQTQGFLDKIDQLTNTIETKIGNINNDISKVKSEIEKRIPTKKEILQKRITLSNPFIQTPENYWNKKENSDSYELSDDDQLTKKEYEITSSDLNNSPVDVYKSLGINDNEWNQTLTSIFR